MIERANSLEPLETVQWAFRKQKLGVGLVEGQGELRTYFFENIPGLFNFFTFPLKIPDKKNSTPVISTKLC